jgi:hypothetical protein
MREEERINNVISVCRAQDIDVWKISSVEILKNIRSDLYTLIVPKKDIEIFKKKTPKEYQIHSEDIYISKSIRILLKKKTKYNKKRFNWYLQQFIKIEAAKNIKKDDIFVIWDADTIPLKKIIFYKSKKILFYKGLQPKHKPYFDLIEKTFLYDKNLKYSLIAQCMAFKGAWIKSFYNYFIKKYKVNWKIFYINNINFREQSGFSEFETLGNFFYKNFKNDIKFLKNNWCLLGYSEIRSLKNFQFQKKKLSKKYFFISFEKWDNQMFQFKRFFQKIFYFLYKIFYR